MSTRNYYPRDLLTLLGFKRQMFYRRAGVTWLSGLGLLGVGIAVGAGAGLLLAPKPGRELRGDLTRQAGRLGDQIRRRVPALDTVRDAANNVYDRTPSRG